MHYNDCLSYDGTNGDWNNNPRPSSVLDVTSTNQGFLPPRVASVNDISNPVKGLMVYDEFNNCIRFYNGTGWSACIDGTYATNTGCYALVDATTYKDFLCHNLGADNSLDPHIPALGLLGGYVQWGRRGPNTTDDSRNDWQTAVNTSNFAAAPTLVDPNENTIIGWSQFDALDGSWNSGTEAAPVKETADPCPTGFRVPSRAEWQAVYDYNIVSRTGIVWNLGNYGSAIHWGDATTPKILTLPVAGFRNKDDGDLDGHGVDGYYWSSTEDDIGVSYYLDFNFGSVDPSASSERTKGFSVRCIEE